MANNVKFFEFSSNCIHVQFFETAPIYAEMWINDDMDSLMIVNIRQRVEECGYDTSKIRELACEIIGPETVDAVAERSGSNDFYVYEQILGYLHQTYTEQRSKNVRTARAGIIRA